MHAFHNSRYLQSKWMFDLSYASMIKVQYMSKWCNPLYWKGHKHSKMIETHFYRVHSIMAGSKIIAGSQPKVWNLIL